MAAACGWLNSGRGDARGAAASRTSSFDRHEPGAPVIAAISSDPASPARTPPADRAPLAPCTEVRAGGRVVARATTQLVPGPAGDTLTIHIDREAGHQPPWARRLLMHDLLNRAGHAGIEHVLLVIPLGDVELVEAVREHADGVATRAAGSSCIVEARVVSRTRIDRG